MTQKKLGRGLDYLLPSSDDELLFLPISSIIPNPEQPRKKFDKQKLAELAESIREYGVIQPIVVKKEWQNYVIVAGERRFRAAKMVGLTEIKAILFKGEDNYRISLIENLQREDLNPIEVAEAYRELMKRFNYTQEQLSEKVGKSRSEISNHIRLLNLTEKIQDLVRNGSLSVGQVRPLAVLDRENQEFFLEKIVNEKLTAREVEKLVASANKTQKSRKPAPLAISFKLQEKEIAAITKARTAIKAKKEGMTLVLDFSSADDFNDFFNKIKDLG